MTTKLQKKLMFASKQALYLFLIQAITMQLLLAGVSSGQKLEDIHLTVHYQDVALTEILSDMQARTQFAFSYNQEVLKGVPKLTVHSTEASVRDILLEIASKGDLQFKRVNDNISVIKASKRMKQEERLLELNRTITGKVTDAETGEPLVGATIQVKSTSIGTISDIDGNFKLSVPDGSEVLVVSFIGFKTYETLLDNRSVVEVVLKPDLSALSEVVVVGYGTQKRNDLTGAISSLDQEVVEEMAVSSFDQILKARIAGVQVSQTSHLPGGGVSIRVRGGNSITAGNEPLYVVDGFPIINTQHVGSSRDNQQPINPLSSINPNDIESIEVLKDASATAIYGARGANGVILITTKQGVSGKGTINLNVYYGVQQVANKLDVLNARQFAVLSNEAYSAAGDDPIFVNSDGNATEAYLDSIGEGTDWQDELFRVAPMQDYQISFSGGNKDKGSYFLSANFFSQDGIVEGSDFKRFSLRFNGMQQVAKKLKVGNSLSVSRTSSDRVATEGSNSVVRSALRISPTLPVYDEFGNYTWGGEIGNGISSEANPLFLANAVTRENYLTRILGNAFLEYQIVDNLTFRTSAGADLVFGNSNYYIPREPRGNQNTNGLGFGSVLRNQSLSFLNENTLSYAQQFGEHDVSALAGFTLQTYNFEQLEAISDQFTTDELTFYNLSNATRNAYFPLQSYDESGILSFLGRVNYNYADKYLLTATAREDGSSKFGKNNKWGFFPSFAAAWRISNEQFFPTSDILSDLKIRASYGITGNQNISSYASLGQVTSSNYIFDELASSGSALSNVANPELKWETTAQADIGVDAVLLNGRLSLIADYYYKKTTDLLYSKNLARTTGFRTSVQNIGSLENEGFELTLNSTNVDAGNWLWETSFNISTNRNKVLDIGDDELFLTSVDGILREGEAVGSFYGYRFDGIFQSVAEVAESAQPDAQPGDIRFKDISGPEGMPDGIISSDDRTIVGNALPKWYGGLNNRLTYGGLELDFLFQFNYGNDINNQTKTEILSLNGRTNQTSEALNRWTPDNPSTTVPRATYDTPPFSFSDYNLEDGSFLRLSSLTLGYSFFPKNSDNSAFKKIRLYANGQNLFILTDYSGFDPEVNRFGQSTLNIGADYYGYPSARIVRLGIDVSF